MIIELAGLPGSGKSTLAAKLAESTGMQNIRMRSHFSSLVWGGVFFMLHPVFSYLFLIACHKAARRNKRLHYSLIMNAWLGAAAKHQFASLYGGIIDQGWIQSLIALLPESEEEIINLYARLPSCDLIVWCEAPSSVRAKRLEKRKMAPREEFGELEKERFKDRSLHSYQIVRHCTSNKVSCTVDSSQKDTTSHVLLFIQMVQASAVSRLRQFAKTALLFLAFSLARPPARSRREVVVLMYHAVNNSGWKHAIIPEEFERQMKYLSRRGGVVPLSKIAAYMQGEPNMPRTMTAVTFDDGYQDFSNTVLPIVEKYQIPVTLFLTTDLTLKTNLIGTTRISKDELVKLSNNPLISIESHGRSHSHLTTLSKKEVLEELAHSMKDIEVFTGTKPIYFAYPYGSRNLQIEEAVREAGYIAGFSITEGIISPYEDSFHIKRVQVDKTISFTAFRLRMTSALVLYRRLTNFVRVNLKP